VKQPGSAGTLTQYCPVSSSRSIKTVYLATTFLIRCFRFPFGFVARGIIVASLSGAIYETKFFAKKLAERLKDLHELVTPAADFVQFLRDDRHPLNDD
jgi:hypothetical protein